MFIYLSILSILSIYLFIYLYIYIFDIFFYLFLYLMVADIYGHMHKLHYFILIYFLLFNAGNQ